MTDIQASGCDDAAKAANDQLPNKSTLPEVKAPAAAIAAVAESGASAISQQSVAVLAPATAPVPAFNPPAHSIAVLPFTNMSGDKEQEFFSDGLWPGVGQFLRRVSRTYGRTSGIRASAHARTRRCKSIERLRRVRRPHRPH